MDVENTEINQWFDSQIINVVLKDKQILQLEQGMKVRVGIIICEKIPRLPKKGNIIISTDDSMIFQLIIAYACNFLASDNNQSLNASGIKQKENKHIVVTRGLDDKDMLFKSIFKEKLKTYDQFHLQFENHGYKNTTVIRKNLADLQKTISAQISPGTNVVVFGPIWLQRIVKRAARGQVLCYGFQTLFGPNITKYSIQPSHFMLLHQKNLHQFDDYLAIDSFIAKWIDIDRYYKLTDDVFN